jgi:hypothetical protein
MWLISGRVGVLTARHADVIHTVWRSGLGLYIAGDNAPYFADANILLRRLDLPVMVGNFHGASVLRPGTDYIEHEVTTGIEGETADNVLRRRRS